MNLRQHNEEQMKKDYDLLKKLEDKRRFENDPREQGKLDADIEEIEQKIRKREKTKNRVIYSTTSNRSTKLYIQYLLSIARVIPYVLVCSIIFIFYVIKISKNFKGNDRTDNEEKITFTCENNQRGLYTTYVNFNKKKKPFVEWEIKDFTGNGYPPIKRCMEVTPRIQESYNSGKLKYITNKVINKQPVICAASELWGECEKLLITLRNQDNIESELISISKVILGKSEVYKQSSGDFYQKGDDIYVEIDMDKFIN